VVENSNEQGYISEKMFQVLTGGAVPLYHGAPDVRKFLPHPDAAILLQDFKSTREAMHYLIRVSREENLYRKHTAWKRLPFSPGFRHLLSTTFNPCTVCETFARDASPVAKPWPNPMIGPVHRHPKRVCASVKCLRIVRSWGLQTFLNRNQSEQKTRHG